MTFDLRAFLESHRRRYQKQPDELHVKDIASVYRTTVRDVKQVIDEMWQSPVPPVASSLPVHHSRAPARSTDFQTAVSSDARHPYHRVLDALRAHGCRILPKHDTLGREASRATCPAHDDRNPSLVVTSDGPNALLYCFGGCPTARIVAALGMKLADLFSGTKQPRASRHRRTPAKPAVAPSLSAEERLARRRKLTAARTRRWRELARRRASRRAGDAPEHTERHRDAGDAGDAPNVLGTSHEVSVPKNPVPVPIYPDVPVDRYPEVPEYLPLTMTLGGDDGDEDD